MDEFYIIVRARGFNRARAIHAKFPNMVRSLAIVIVLLFIQTAHAQDLRISVWSGAYTDAQAERGRKAFEAYCASCHQKDLGGKGEVPALKGDGFMERWHDYAVKPLFDMIRTEMPPLRFRTPETKPLADDVYVDIISYILKTNGFPSGTGELGADSLNDVLILGKNGVQPPPQFALVLSVGCLRFKPTGWSLAYATTLVRATMPDLATKDEVDEAKTARLGNREYRLADFGYLGRQFDPDFLENHRIVVKGYIIRQPEFERISVTSITDASADCD